MNFTAMELSVIQTNDSGFFGETSIVDFECEYGKTIYRFRIEKRLKREIRIGTDRMVECEELFKMEELIEQLLFLFDGRFFPIENVTLIDENENPGIYEKEVNENFYNKRLPIYNSSDICREPYMKLVDYKDINMQTVIGKWAKLFDELDIVFSMFLYCLSDIRMPVDCKITSVIEMAKPITELVEKYNSSYSVKRNKNNRLSLKLALESLINNFGDEIFGKEQADFDSFLNMLVNTRNTISHINFFKGKDCLNGTQCVFYIAKLSILYRKIIFILFGFAEDVYDKNIQKAINAWDNWYYKEQNAVE